MLIKIECERISYSIFFANHHLPNNFKVDLLDYNVCSAQNTPNISENRTKKTLGYDNYFLTCNI